MKRRWFILSMMVIGFGTSVVFGSDAQLVELAMKDVTLTQKIISEYKHRNSATAIVLAKELESGQKKLGSKIHNREIRNLLQYLNLCVSDMKKVLQKPYSRENSLKLSDLSASLMEGNQYIAKRL